MKINPDLKPEDIVKLMQGPPEGLDIKRLDRPESAAEKADHLEKFAKVIRDPSKIRSICGGCGADQAVLEMKICECGAFICSLCEEMEEEGVCEHELPSLLEGWDEDDN